MNKEKKEKLLKEILETLHKSTIAVPVINGYEVIKEQTDALIVAKSMDNSIEQFLEDGKLEEDETFEERLEKVLKETKKSMVDSGLEEKDLVHFGSFDNPFFHFEVYIQDNIKGDIQIRQMNAYFIEPGTRYFYEISLAAPPLNLKDINDQVTKNIYSLLEPILRQVQYNSDSPIK